MVIFLYFWMLIDRQSVPEAVLMLYNNRKSWLVCYNVTRGTRAYNRSQELGLTCCSSISSPGQDKILIVLHESRK